MNETIKKVTDETTQGKSIKDAINTIVDKMMLKDFGINEKALELCPDLLTKIDRAIGAIGKGEKEQREVAISFFENLERLGIVKPGTSLDMKDSCYNFNKLLFRNYDFGNSKSDTNKGPKIKNNFIEVPQEKGMSKEEFEKNIMQQIKEQDAELPKEFQDVIINEAWKSYQRNVKSDQEENSNV